MAAPVPVAESRIPLRIESVAKHFGEVTALAGVSFEIHERACFGCSAPMARANLRSFAASWAAYGPTRATYGYSARRQTLPQPARRWAGCPRNWRSTRSSPAARTWKPSAATRVCVAKRCASDPMVPGMGRARRPRGAMVKTLSGGMRRRLNMAAGLIHRPRIRAARRADRRRGSPIAQSDLRNG